MIETIKGYNWVKLPYEKGEYIHIYYHRQYDFPETNWIGLESNVCCQSSWIIGYNIFANSAHITQILVQH